jgi:prepilin-type N-terminal cleavage/methylation domain-containing protein
MRGATLLETLVVLAIAGTVAAFAVPALGGLLADQRRVQEVQAPVHPGGEPGMRNVQPGDRRRDPDLQPRGAGGAYDHLDADRHLLSTVAGYFPYRGT